MRLLLFFAGIAILLGGCNSTEPQKTTPKEKNSQQDVVEKKNQNSENKVPSNGQKSPGADNKNGKSVVSYPTSDGEVIPPPQTNVTLPPESQEQQQLAISSEHWQQAREVLILQFLRNPKYIVWGIQNPLSSEVAQYLERGYGTAYTPTSDISKELEYGFFKARAHNTEEIQDNMQALQKIGGGRDYYLLAYITTRYYLHKDMDQQAKQLANTSKLFSGLETFQINLTSAQTQSLKASIEQIPETPDESEEASWQGSMEKEQDMETTGSESEEVKESETEDTPNSEEKMEEDTMEEDTMEEDFSFDSEMNNEESTAETPTADTEEEKTEEETDPDFENFEDDFGSFEDF